MILGEYSLSVNPSRGAGFGFPVARLCEVPAPIRPVWESRDKALQGWGEPSGALGKWDGVTGAELRSQPLCQGQAALLALMARDRRV